MYIDDSLLSYEEDLGLRLRSLYQQSGYRRFTMGKFEEYDLYAQFRDFLPSEQVISFTDTTGKLMALKPDVTLFYAANNKVAPGAVGRVYYAENVYRVSKITGAFKEIMQVGVECLGSITDEDISRVLVLAARSLDTVSPANVMAITSLDILSEALETLGLPEPRR
ncbi:MAG: ATP phosphoribosyltransferase regulatory subunit, partial [Eggerthellaceae bacterium]|nr:ATP phosphoribosyltransferase regulatory subunit [Eggerthellaceae bacterium]